MSHAHAAEPEAAGAGTRILVGVDLSPACYRVYREALTVARARGGRLFALHVIDGAGIAEMARLAGLLEGDLRDRLGRDRRERLEDFARRVGGPEVEVPVQMILAWGRPFEQIVRKANDLDVDLVVLGISGASADIERALFGSTAEKVLRSTSRPVLCVPAE
jgi:nucleotide-binding universal stress UspA family protein